MLEGVSQDVFEMVYYRVYSKGCVTRGIRGSTHLHVAPSSPLTTAVSDEPEAPYYSPTHEARSSPWTHPHLGRALGGWEQKSRPFVFRLRLAIVVVVGVVVVVVVVWREGGRGGGGGGRLVGLVECV